MAKPKEIKVKLIIADHYLSFEYGLYKGMILDAIPRYTSTKKLKGYGVISPKKRTEIFLNLNEIKTM